MINRINKLQEKIDEWITIAEEDLSTAELCLTGGKFLWAMVNVSTGY